MDMMAYYGMNAKNNGKMSGTETTVYYKKKGYRHDEE